MPTVDVYIDTYDVLADLSDAEIARELERRRKARAGAGKQDATQPWTPLGLAEDLRTAFYARNTSRFETLLCALDDGRPWEVQQRGDAEEMAHG